VAIVPDVAGRLINAGFAVLVERGAGDAAMFPDAAFTAVGATIVDAAEIQSRADLVVRVQRPAAAEVAAARSGTGLVALFQPGQDPALLRQLAERGVTAFTLARLPRITRAQPMDVLSSQATVAGYKAVLLAAGASGRFFPMLVTAAGTLPPARVLVLGAGVAGLQAIATARRLGAVVSAFDVRPAVKEQVESLGAAFLDMSLVEDTETAGGYAKELSADAHQREMDFIARHVGEADVVVTTALIPGKPAPRLITEAAVQSMRSGSVIVDLAAEAGGNCEVTEPGA
jgi:NAD(P) transhydrogenase subunit alpha